MVECLETVLCHSHKFEEGYVSVRNLFSRDTYQAKAPEPETGSWQTASGRPNLSLGCMGPTE